jgi:hypothetical protein
MMTRRKILRLRGSVLAVHGALGLMGSAWAQTDPALVELTQPRHTVEVGIASSGPSSAKANEYTGLVRQDAYLFSHFDLRGGGAYDSKDATRWRLTGLDLGTRSASLSGDYGVQGSYRWSFSVDQLLRNQSDTYQTPYLGIGTSTLTLPANWKNVVIPELSATTPTARGLSPAVTNSSVIVKGVLTPPTAAQVAAATAVQSADLPAFRRIGLSTQRTGFNLGWEDLVGERWRFNASYGEEHKSGLKPLGAHSHATGGDVSSILPIPIDQDDRKASLAASYTADSLQLQAVVDVAAFTNNVPSVSWNLWSAPALTATMSTAPGNVSDKVALTANYAIATTTHVVASYSHASTWQNAPFLNDTTAPVVPVASAHARVVNEVASLKLSDHTLRNLNLSVGFKHDLRENHTPINTYLFYDNNEAPSGTSPFQYLYPAVTGMGTNINIAANTPYSRKVNQGTFDADYQLGPDHHLKAGWNTSRTERYCLGTWVSCVNAAHATDNTLHADWIGNPLQDLSLRLGYTGARRKVDYDENSFLARVPAADQTPSGAPAGTTAYDAMLALGLNGYGPVLGLAPAAPAGSALAYYFPLNNALGNTFYGYRNRISELQGMRRFDQADRDRHQVQSSLAWQATERLEVTAGADFTQDRYGHSVYGLQRASNHAFNLDGTYTTDDDFSVSLFGALEEQRLRLAGNTYTANSAAANVGGATIVSGGCFDTVAARNANNKIDACENWISNSRDRTLTFGASLTKKRLLSGKLDVSGSLIYNDGRTDIGVTGGSYVNNPYAGVAAATNGTIGAYYIPAAPLPTVRSRALDLRLSGTWQVSATSAVHVAYGLARLLSRDWAYEGMQDGVLTQVLPTREQAPTYLVNSIAISYVASWR